MRPFSSAIDSIPVIIRKDSVELFGKYKVFTERELQARYTIFCESYVKTINIEANLMVSMSKTMVLAAALRYQGEVASSVNATKAAGVDNAAQLAHLKDLTAAITEFQASLAKLESAHGHDAHGDAYAHAKQMRDTVLPKMVELRTVVDKLETMVADDLWPLPTYREMLFVK